MDIAGGDVQRCLFRKTILAGDEAILTCWSTQYIVQLYMDALVCLCPTHVGCWVDDAPWMEWNEKWKHRIQILFTVLMQPDTVAGQLYANLKVVVSGEQFVQCMYVDRKLHWWAFYLDQKQQRPNRYKKLTRWSPLPPVLVYIMAWESLFTD